MYGNTPPPGGALIIPGGLAVTGIDGLQGVGLTVVALGLLVSGALLFRSAYLKRSAQAA